MFTTGIQRVIIRWGKDCLRLAVDGQMPYRAVQIHGHCHWRSGLSRGFQVPELGLFWWSHSDSWGFWRTPWLQLYIQYLIYLFFGWFSEVRVVQGQIVVGTCWNLMNNCRKPWFAIYLGLVLQATTIFQTLATLMLLHGQVRSCSTCRPSGNST